MNSEQTAHSEEIPGEMTRQSKVIRECRRLKRVVIMGPTAKGRGRVRDMKGLVSSGGALVCGIVACCNQVISLSDSLALVYRRLKFP